MVVACVVAQLLLKQMVNRCKVQGAGFMSRGCGSWLKLGSCLGAVELAEAGFTPRGCGSWLKLAQAATKLGLG